MGAAVTRQVNLVSVLADVARALVKLHGAGHLHRDVKARNVLVRWATAATLENSARAGPSFRQSGVPEAPLRAHALAGRDLPVALLALSSPVTGSPGSARSAVARFRHTSGGATLSLEPRSACPSPTRRCPRTSAWRSSRTSASRGTSRRPEA